VRAVLASLIEVLGFLTKELENMKGQKNLLSCLRPDINEYGVSLLCQELQS